MPEPKHNLPTRYNRLDDQITGPVLDAIMIYPHSHGVLHLPGEYSTGSRPAPHKVEVATGEPGNPRVYTDQNQPGRPDHYTVNYDIWNHRDSPTFARITLTGATKASLSTRPSFVVTNTSQQPIYDLKFLLRKSRRRAARAIRCGAA